MMRILINPLKTKMNICNIGSLVYWDNFAGHFLLVTLLFSACLNELPCAPAVTGVFTFVVMKS